MDTRLRTGRIVSVWLPSLPRRVHECVYLHSTRVRGISNTLLAVLHMAHLALSAVGGAPAMRSPEPVAASTCLGAHRIGASRAPGRLLFHRIYCSTLHFSSFRQGFLEGC